ncbi:hypothetical protein OG379_40770 (plasmid) [Streptomyces sp. NBC_01166]|uniref:hypothetical protein n=1 Tax=Streptomyces sp. NBC_01166 TaxID=2903755 RepID=UPI00386E7EFC|nr:hypothetical protein OG379_40770 [Streptomyces sp. NBC_01166]
MNEITNTAAPRAPRTWNGFAASAAMQGFVGASGCWDTDSFAGIRTIGCYIDGSWAPEPGGREVRPPAAGSWTELIGRPGALALRAAAPATRPERREVLLDFLDMWADTPFADPAFLFRLGRLAGETSFTVRDHQGASFGLHLPAARRTLYFEAVLPGGEAAPRPEEPLYVVDCHRGWGTPDQLLRLVELVHERGPIPWDADAAIALSEATGLSRPAAALVLAGNPGAGGYYTPFLDEHECALYGFKAGELESARDELSMLHDDERLALLADVLPSDPADLWESGGLARVAERIAAVWVEQHGARAHTPWSTWQAAVTLGTEMPAAHLCHLLLDPANATLPPGFYLRIWPCPPEHRHLRTAWDVMGRYDAETVADAFFASLPWAYADLPAGDPVRNGAPEAVRHLRKVLAGGDSPARVLYAGVIRGSRGSQRWDWLTDGTCDRVIARITSGDLPPGRYESDPRACVPDLLADVAHTLDLSEDAAALYLQLLLLPVPSDRNVRRWNAWKPTRHKAASAELSARGLVVEDRRARAGRSLFLPGPWAHAKKPLPPMESWKAPLIGAQLSTDGTEVRDFELLPGTLPELFTEAWRLVRKGEGPTA